MVNNHLTVAQVVNVLLHIESAIKTKFVHIAATIFYTIVLQQKQ